MTGASSKRSISSRFENVRWRALPDRFGPWSSVWKRFDRLSKAGVFEAFFDALASMSSSAHLIQMFDSTIGARMCRPPEQRGARRASVGRSRGGFTTKIHAKSNASGDIIAFDLTGGEASDARHFNILPDIGPDIQPRAVLCDKGFRRPPVLDQIRPHGLAWILYRRFSVLIRSRISATSVSRKHDICAGIYVTLNLVVYGLVYHGHSIWIHLVLLGFVWPRKRPRGRAPLCRSRARVYSTSSTATVRPDKRCASEASMNGSRAPSSTSAGEPDTWPVRRSFTIW